MSLVRATYSVVKTLPAEERFELGSQLRRAAVSVAANIAESCGRSAPRDRLRILAFARASAVELDTLLAIVEMFGMSDASLLNEAYERLEHSGRLMSGLKRRFQSLVTSH